MGLHVRAELHSEPQEAVQHCVRVSSHNIQIHNESWSAKVLGELGAAGHLKRAAQMTNSEYCVVSWKLYLNNYK